MKKNFYQQLKSIRRAFIWAIKNFPSHSDFGHCGTNAMIEGPCYAEYPQSVYIDKNVKIRANLQIINTSTESVYIGSYTVLASHVTIVTNSHRSTVGIPQFLLGASHINDKSAGVIIKEDVWVGTGVIIMPGVTLGRGCIVAAGSLVTRSVPPYALVVGSPAKIVKAKYSYEQILKHEEILYPAKLRMTQNELSSLFAHHFKGMGFYGVETILSDEEKKLINNLKENSHFVELR